MRIDIKLMIIAILFNSIKICSKQFAEFTKTIFEKSENKWVISSNSRLKNQCISKEIFGNVASVPQSSTIAKTFTNLYDYSMIELNVSLYIVDHKKCSVYDIISITIDSKIIFQLKSVNKKKRNSIVVRDCGITEINDSIYKISIKESVKKSRSHTIEFQFRNYNKKKLRKKYESTCYFGFRDFFLTFKNCILNCLNCDKNNKCLSCKSNFRLKENKCEKCSKDSAKTYNLCKLNSYYHNGRCLSNCPEGYFKDGKKCSKCHYSCKNCEGSYNYCLSCISNKFYFNHSCSDKCPEGYFKNNKNCTGCDLTCRDCKEYRSRCVLCYSDRSLAYNRCVKNECSEGYFKDGKKCSKCHYSCKQCQDSSNNCLSCNDNKVYFNHTCCDKCPEGYFNDTKQCSKCDSTCKQCQDSSNNCLTCNDNKVYFNHSCCD